jgi:hypothetical protein
LYLILYILSNLNEHSYIIIHYIFYDTNKGNKSFSDKFQVEVDCTVLLKGYQKEGKKVKLFLRQAVEAHRLHEMLRLPHLLDSRLTDGGEVVSCMPPPQVSWYSLPLEAESTPGW